LSSRSFGFLSIPEEKMAQERFFWKWTTSSFRKGESIITIRIFLRFIDAGPQFASKPHLELRSCPSLQLAKKTFGEISQWHGRADHKSLFVLHDNKFVASNRKSRSAIPYVPSQMQHCEGQKWKHNRFSDILRNIRDSLSEYGHRAIRKREVTFHSFRLAVQWITAIS
jgi:hypothetical protein